MNFEEVTLDVLLLSPFQVKEALRCVLHTILFNRSLGPLTPQEVESELFDITYMRAGSTRIDKEVELAIEKFASSLSFERKGTARGQIALSFYEKRNRTSFFGTSKEEKRYWEKWIIPVILQTTSQSKTSYEEAHNKRKQRAENALRDCLLDVVARLSKKKEHLPPVNLNKSDPMIFTFEITPVSGNESESTWFSRLLQTTSPPLLSS